MASANWAAAGELQAKIPHTYAAFEHLIMSMADAHNNKGKSTFFGYDKGLKSYVKFEERLKNSLIAMTLDGLVSRFDSAEEFRSMLVSLIALWFEIFPNWNDAEAFAREKFTKNPTEARKLIAMLIGLSK